MSERGWELLQITVEVCLEGDVSRGGREGGVGEDHNSLGM